MEISILNFIPILTPIVILIVVIVTIIVILIVIMILIAKGNVYVIVILKLMFN